jgi:beta-glucanase (GH16 family)
MGDKNMSRKLLLLMICLLMILTIVACDDKSSTTTQTTNSITDIITTTTSKQVSTTKLVDVIPSDCASVDIVGGWVPTWCDEFKYVGAVDSSKWNHQNGGGGFGNQEKQYYTNRSENAYVDGEYLTITALKESYQSHNYTSSKIWTQGVANFKYGKIEMRAKLPSGRGTWPAFWMMPTLSKYGGWPKSGEIDIMEHVGYNPNVILGTLHTERFNGTNGRGVSTNSLINDGTLIAIDALNQFHTYGIIWNETSIEWFFDGYSLGKVSYSPTKSQSYLYPTSVDWPFDQNFYIILNLAVGGTWGGAQGIDDTIFPTEFVIDYVRVYQQDYISDDVENPSRPSNPQLLSNVDRKAYLTWKASTDDNAIRRYAVYVNGNFKTYTTVNGVQIIGLLPNTDNMIKIIAEDYSGKVSEPLETVITTLA